ncbi:DEAD/DEAH box helicase [Rhodococcus sp. BP-349]|uniref:DEAD/DEAH box helicase n=1 Tax=unclassified Rhodococcus (in: high G+C Gram-positive bacteria) TaxID=192944 RepID=UPI001C9B9CA1|nr:MULTISPECIES: DEAD/DEAH box helicase [unclassified Rhodococcus (in: high G+C Gram-positive bacteria)]MBY6540035.1 DEAD/DEAH box helicase [Rhodococcus sp. BP-363]MBY6543637.1 DEAD/DEAH box helicase [Rhodococcus sp. BP-369]MBY6562867.1 DEAD/DEAH box helicase [Rhodococcus sp. BP-370]MBY6577159.1 DEAD/DEAH box helicase [Rhodococcus sp. BP-364]MBY6586460.1 DEAD/DEAH box helicase [Rhodococcus sp. BP-358]
MTGASAEDLLREINALLGEGVAATRAADNLRGEIRTSVDNILDRQTDAILRARPVVSLKPALAMGVRFGELSSSRLRTVLDVADASAADLSAVPGIGPQSARAIRDAAVAQRRVVRSSQKLRLSPASKTGPETELLKSLTALRRVERESVGLAVEVQAVDALVKPWRDAAGRSSGWFARLFTSKAKKAEAERARYQIRAIAGSAGAVGLREHIARVADAGRLSGDPWAEYERDAAALNALLSQFTSLGNDSVNSSHGFIGDRLSSETEKVELDRTHMRSYLRAYQAFGARYILLRGKCILGDEMGLGKTIQALAVAAHLSAKGDKLFLVICPASVLINWSNETQKHTALRPVELYGADRDRAVTEWQRSGGVAITTFTTLQKLRISVVPSLVVIDEAHYVKNPVAQRSIASRAIIESADRAVLLSGTPMENRVSEFRTLVEYVQPATARGIKSTDGISGAEAFRRAVAPAYLRRNQVDVLGELPDLIEVEDWVEPTADDKDRYRSAVASRNFMAMRQAAYTGDSGSKSAKLDRLIEIVREAEDSGSKVLVFSFFKSVLDTVSRQVPGTVFGPLTGATTSIQRQRMIDDFTSCTGPAVLVSQIEAGGVGLNIQAASVVILAEPQWKPSTEVQAVARAHRMGQVRTVQVHRLLAKESVDERMREVQDKKSQLFDEYARRSQAKDADVSAVDSGWDRGVGPAEASIIEVERARLGVG